MKTLIASLLYVFGAFALALWDACFWNWTVNQRIWWIIVTVIVAVLADIGERNG